MFYIFQVFIFIIREHLVLINLVNSNQVSYLIVKKLYLQLNQEVIFTMVNYYIDFFSKCFTVIYLNALVFFVNFILSLIFVYYICQQNIFNLLKWFAVLTLCILKFIYNYIFFLDIIIFYVNLALQKLKLLTY